MKHNAKPEMNTRLMEKEKMPFLKRKKIKRSESLLLQFARFIIIKYFKSYYLFPISAFQMRKHLLNSEV